MLKRIVSWLLHYEENASPIKLTVVQTIAATLLATLMAALTYLLIGQFNPGIAYQIIVTLVIAGIVAPIFLYPSLRNQQRLAEAKSIIEVQAKTDFLTGLPNMLSLAEHLDSLVARADQETTFALHFLDINRFKQINDTLGHDVGNEFIRAFAQRLDFVAGPNCFIARFGGDEFVVVQYNIADEQDAAQFGRDIRKQMAHRYQTANNEINVTASVGSAVFPIHGTSPKALLKAADLALFRAKEQTNSNCVFDPSFADDASNCARIENTLRTCIEDGTLKPYYHSIVDAKNPLRIQGFEALSRIDLPNGERLTPSEFIPIAENTGLIVDIGAHILRQACKACASWHPDLFVSVNVSPVQLIRSDFITTVHEALTESGLSAYRLELEITESALVNDIDLVRQSLDRIRAMGVQIALDDFGAGYCGLHYLRKIEIDKIKIDKSIIDEAEDVAIARNILQGLTVLAKQMDIVLVAEGVDSIQKAEFLTQGNKVHQFQGHLFSTPVDAKTAFRMQECLPRNCYTDNVIPLPVRSNDW